LHFAESCEEAWAVANQLAAPVVLVDRDWPGAGWRTIVESLVTLRHQASVILVSGVVDDYLWQEVIRLGGYDVLSKPLRTDNVARVVKLAFSYWKSAPKRAVPASGRRK
jgi:FixJ family two-component response regulator